MPRIHDALLDCIFYIYEDEDAARRTEQVGGTGFLVGVDSMMPGLAYLYGVTASHNIRESGVSAPALRFNTKDGGIFVHTVRASEWIHHQHGDDVAVCRLELDGEAILRLRAVSLNSASHMLTKEIIEEFAIGPGDEAFMIGRFIHHDGKQANTPCVRFGNIAMMPQEPIRLPRGINQEAFLVETRSLSGFSGSPVFVWIPMLSPPRPNWTSGVATGQHGPWLVGVDIGHLPICEDVLDKDCETKIDERYKVRINSGAMIVVPSWRIMDIINSEDEVAYRET